METIKGIGFENLRVFKERSDFDLAPITILTGANSSGKSTVIKALKLFQTYWNNKDGQLNLYFEEGDDSNHHQLGNFNISLSRNTGKSEIVVRYYFSKNIFLGNFYMENIFELNKSNSMENGLLKKSSIFQDIEGEITLLYETKHVNNKFYYFVNNNHFLNTLIPEFFNLYEELKLYREKAKLYLKDKPNKKSKNNGEIDDFGDYKGPAMYHDIDSKAHPLINEEFSNFLGVNYEKIQSLDEIFGIFYPVLYAFGDREELIKLFKNFENYEPDTYLLGSKSKILKLLSKIPVDKYESLERELWCSINNEYPEVVSRYDENSFKDLITDIENEIYNEYVYEEPGLGLVQKREILSFSELKSLLIENVSVSFESFYKELEIKKINESLRREQDDYGINYFTKESYKKNWDLDNGFFPKNKELKKSKSNSNSKYNTDEYFNFLFDYIKRIEQKLFGSYNDSSTVIKLLNGIHDYLNSVTFKVINNFSYKIIFIDSVRANTQRLFTQTSQGTSFNKLISDYMRRGENKRNSDFVKKWLTEFDLGEDIFFDTIGGVGTQIFIIKDGNKINLVDMGYGMTQLIPLLMKISLTDYNYTIVIEEPETNLHPKLQSNLADLFIDAHKRFKVNFIIETHSEYLIRKMQYLTAKGDIKTDETVIHYIGYPDKDKRDIDEDQIRTIHIKPNGQLSKPFGTGFTDESSNWIKEMFMYSQK